MIAIILDLIPRFSFADWTVLVVGAFLFTFSILIFLQDATKRRGKFFLFLSGATLSFGAILVALGGAMDAYFFYGAFVSLLLVAGLIPLILFLFFYVFPKKEEPFSFKKALAIFSPFVIVAGLMLAPDFVAVYQPIYQNVFIGDFFGKGYLFYIGYIVSFLALTLYVLTQKYKNSVGIFRTQTQSIILSFVGSVGVSLALLFFVPRPWSVYSIFLIGYIGLIVNGFFIGYILVKYNFWSFKLIGTKFFICATFSCILASIFFVTSLPGILIAGTLAVLVVLGGFYMAESTKRELRIEDEIIRLSNELNDLRTREKVLAQKKSEFLETASHHLRDPLTAIKGYSSMLLEGSFGELTDRAREAVEKIFESSKRLVTMISDFMDISSIESGSMLFTFARVNLKDLVYETAQSMKDEAAHSGVSMEVVVNEKDGADYSVNADLKRMRQVILNLIDNAVKYTPRGNVTILLSSSGSGTIFLRVSDTGIGMNEITMEKIFRKFSRAEGANKTYTEGIGLGLYVAKEIIRKHNGRIWAESKGEGFGSTFYIELPKS